MVVYTGPLGYLPIDLAISERSRQFYDGTYTWDSNGFTDDCGVYREFDCYDPEARAPTPLPPMFSDDEERSDPKEIATKDSPEVRRTDSSTTSRDVTTPEPDTLCPISNGNAASMLDARTPVEPHQCTIASTANPKQSDTVRQHELLVGHQNKDTLVSNLEGFVAASEQARTGSSLNKGHRSCEIPSPAKEEVASLKLPDTPPESPVKIRFGVQTTSPTSTASTLSPVPSNLSDQDKDLRIKIKGTSTTARSTPSLPNTPPKSSPRPKGKVASTRGVARKVTKGSKKASGSKSSPPKRKDDSVEDFTLLELHSGAYMRKGGRRRSVRQAKLEGS